MNHWAPSRRIRRLHGRVEFQAWPVHANRMLSVGISPVPKGRFRWLDLSARNTRYFDARLLKQIVCVNEFHDCDLRVRYPLFGGDSSPFPSNAVPIHRCAGRAFPAEMSTGHPDSILLVGL